jgi:hypothetical protein
MSWEKSNRVIILITKGGKVVSQFPLDEEFLLTQGNQIRNFKEALMI